MIGCCWIALVLGAGVAFGFHHVFLDAPAVVSADGMGDASLLAAASLPGFGFLAFGKIR